MQSWPLLGGSLNETIRPASAHSDRIPTEPALLGFILPLDRVAISSQSTSSNTSGGSDVATTSAQGFSYLASISIGAQILKVILDTGSSDLWVVSSECTDGDCAGVPTYNATSSLILNDVPFNLDYLQGSVSGSIGYETVALGPYQITNQTLALANQTEGLGLVDNGNSGILGLSFPPASTIPRTVGTTLLSNLFAYLPDRERFFAFALGRNGTSSSLSIGRIDPTYANSIEALSYSPVYIGPSDQPDYWKLPLRAITLNGTATFSSFSPSRLPNADTAIAVLDTGTTFILGPSADVEAFWGAIGSARKSVTGQWEVRCERAVSVGFVLGEKDGAKEYVVDPTDISWVPSGEELGWCVGGVQANDHVNSGDWILGDTFLRNVYATHNGATKDQPPRIGLLNLTSPATSLANFRLERGDDPAPPITAGTRVLSTRARRTPISQAVIIVLISLGCFALGVLGSSAVQALRQRHKYSAVKVDAPEIVQPKQLLMWMP